MTSIIEMPELVMEKIIEFSNFKAVLTLRQVCRDFRNFIDDLSDSKLPDSKFTKIEINSDKKQNKILFDFMNSNNSFYRIEYSESANSRKFQETTQFFQNSNIVDVAVRDLELILKFQKSTLEWLYFTLNDSQRQDDSSIHTLPFKLSNMFRASGRQIKARQFITKTCDKSQIMSVLPIADPETLRILNLYSLDDDEVMEIELDEIAETEQWKNAERINCGLCVLNLKTEDVSHFSRLSIKLPSITARDLDILKKTFTSSSKFEHAFLDLKIFNENEEISNLWGPAFISGSSSRWYFRMKNSEEKVMRIEFCYILQFFFFEIIGPRDVLTGAIVQDYNGN
ncbi:unnamed protein product [Caenorhabditis nigoni]